MLAIREALMSGTIDCIASHHLPQHQDTKDCEFEYAKPGMISLETMFAVMNTIGLPVADFVLMQTKNARQIFNLPIPQIKEGHLATLTLFNAGTEYIFDAAMIHSKSTNSPFIGKKLKGKVVGIINKSQLLLN